MKIFFKTMAYMKSLSIFASVFNDKMFKHLPFGNNP